MFKVVKSGTDAEKRCTRCGKRHLSGFVYLELNSRYGNYDEPGCVPAEDSQGLFPFGKTCAARAYAPTAAYVTERT